MKRLIMGVMVIALLAVGAGLLANLGGPQAASHAATGGQGTRVAHRNALRQTPAGPTVPVLRTATPLPHPRTTAVRHGAAGQQTAVAALYHRGPAAQRHG